jgi:hypothetical protein
MKLFLAIFDEFQPQPHNTPTWFVPEPSYLLPSLSFPSFVFISSYHHQHFFFFSPFYFILTIIMELQAKGEGACERGTSWRVVEERNALQLQANEASQFFQMFLPTSSLLSPLFLLSFLFSFFFKFFIVTLFFFWIFVCFHCYQIVQ